MWQLLFSREEIAHDFGDQRFQYSQPLPELVVVLPRKVARHRAFARLSELLLDEDRPSFVKLFIQRSLPRNDAIGKLRWDDFLQFSVRQMISFFGPFPSFSIVDRLQDDGHSEACLAHLTQMRRHGQLEALR